jgi:hypothetical protein
MNWLVSPVFPGHQAVDVRHHRTEIAALSESGMEQRPNGCHQQGRRDAMPGNIAEGKGDVG